MAISQTTIVCKLRSVLLVIEFVFFIKAWIALNQTITSTLVAPTKTGSRLFCFFYPADGLKIHQDTNSKTFCGSSMARKVLAHNGVLQ